ncbi:MAG: glycosyltransferase [Xenophilus sp.]
MSINVAAIVVAYLPDASIEVNLNALSNHVEVIYLVDNSPREVPASIDLTAIASSNRKIIHLPQGANTGIAQALNVGCAQAQSDGFEWVLTMDQDSRVEEEMVNALRAAITGPDAADIGIAAPEIWDVQRGHLPAPNPDPLVVYTSGSLLRLAAWKALGGFDELLFIDAVDIDFCLRLAKGRWRVVQAHGRLRHALGSMRSVLGKKLKIRSYSAFRRYFQARNAVIVVRRHFRRYPWPMVRHCFGVFVVAGAKLLLFERHIIPAFFRGFLDGCRVPGVLVAAVSLPEGVDHEEWRTGLLKRAEKS